MFLMNWNSFDCANCGQGLDSPAAALCQQNICSCGLRLKKNGNIGFYQDVTIFACFAQLCNACKAVMCPFEARFSLLTLKDVSVYVSCPNGNAWYFAFYLLWSHSSAHLPLQRYGVSVVTKCKQLRRVLEL